MAKQFSGLEPHHHRFIAAQHMFFTASAAPTGHVNVSPRSTDMFRVLGDNTVIYLDRTGSGNETAAHLNIGSRLTIMFCAVAGPPLIMRLYGDGRVIHRQSIEFAALLTDQFNGQAPLGARQIIRLDFNLVQTSCGYGVPLFDYLDERPQMDDWAEAKGVDGIENYWRDKNQTSLDGFPTGILDQSADGDAARVSTAGASESEE
ncbi:pyridoxamine 5'-phosphate oxidase family protein [Devosia algicola]|uniref:Pyridoxamine 5'-phosphate oxidase family protein n=1 Tax=Devosia algicola TaxID=3026418 RepID=A0ABY7YJI9_9HYPH|nr:pyridoxamine 5'-phosphate oxidase family protein [Devosia algicola]WDR01254.1 pyridoxamine 5'-phosphate oxidase family protein [Devosia algicola]